MEKIDQILDSLYDRVIEPMEAKEQLLDLFAVMHRSFQGVNNYTIEHLINETYQVVDKIEGTVYHQGSKRDCEVYLNGA
jgi:hypothetical protein